MPPVRHQNVLIDEIVELTSPQTIGKYPKQLRRVVVYNEEKGFTVELLTNNFNWAASTIGELYKSRWLVEIETAAAHQKLCRHVAERGGDTAVDGLDHHADAQISPVQGIIRLESV